MMNNTECIKAFVKGGMGYGYASHIGFTENNFYSYSTCICRIDRTELKAIFNSTKYSVTTSKHQTMLERELINNGYKIEYVEHYDLNNHAVRYWNFGYQGAPNNTADMFR